MTTPLDVLLKGRDHLAKSIWIQGELGSRGSDPLPHRHCTLGAMLCGLQEYEVFLQSDEAAELHMIPSVDNAAKCMGGGTSVVWRNDNPWSSKESMLQLMSVGIERAERVEHPQELDETVHYKEPVYESVNTADSVNSAPVLVTS